ncbi:DNA internalization-related competence protein ComEC/Rec2 [Paenibacillus alkalitolerans]|uniref:DNA internalization-related competence protein ComEC/Rec2 n=1 Tax=Paenibacillus alkalitolerans TaxID=2799335 RepID=UPI0018F57650|nr:DNA internalization-related competence protein ComEC/Rec2 [Paenibacillus alkalitolerans]
MRRPIVGVAVHWVIGMAAAAGGQIANVLIAIAMTAVFWLGACLLQEDAGNRTGLQRLWLYTLALTIGASWYMWNEKHNVSRLAEAFDIHDGTGITARGTIASKPEIDGDRAEFVLETEEAAVEGSKRPVKIKERLKVYLRFASPEEKEKGLTWKRGDVLTASGSLRPPLPATNFGAFDYREYLRRQHIHWMLNVKGLDNVDAGSGSGSRLSMDRAQSYVDEFRRTLAQRLAAVYSEPYAGFMQGLVIGARDGLDPEQFRQFSQIGLTHILAISGLHVAIYVGAVLWLLRRSPLTRETQLACAIAAVPFYIAVTGASPSVVRAGMMAILSLYAARRRLLKDGLHVLSFAAVAMLAWNPYYMHDVSFQLSFAVTAGLIIGVPLMNAAIPIAHRGIRSAVAVTLVAQAVSFPLTLFYFNGFSLLSFPANLAMVPIFSFVVLPLGTLSLLFSFLTPTIASAAAWCGERVAAACFWAVERMNALEGAYTIWASPPVWWIAVYYAALFWLLNALSGAAWGHRFGFTPKSSCAAAALLLSGLLAFAYTPDAFDRSGTVSFLDVGQGDAILIRTPSGKSVLIDGGGTLRFTKPGQQWRERKDPYEVGEDLLVPLLKRRGVQRIDALFISHQDTDHIGGLQAVIEQIPVRRIWFNGTLRQTDTAETLFRTALRKATPLSPASAGDSIRIDDATQVRMLHPIPPSTNDEVSVLEEQNESSIVFVLEMYGMTFLFTGDIGEETERFVLNRLHSEGGGAPSIDVLKIAHHGSKSSTSDEWLQAWRAKSAVISAGRGNVYGHPHPTVIDKLQRRGIAVFRTDSHGEVQFTVTPGHLRVRTKMFMQLPQ